MRVLVTGCFDIIHPGHIHLLKEAAKLGRDHPRVKHNLKDAIVDVVEVEDIEYWRIRVKNNGDVTIDGDGHAIRFGDEASTLDVGSNNLIFQNGVKFYWRLHFTGIGNFFRQGTQPNLHHSASNVLLK